MCYTSSYGLDDLFAKVEKLDWVKEAKPKPSKDNGWGKNFSKNHLEKDFGIQIKVDGEVVHEWTWDGQKEAGLKSVPDKYWNAFLKKSGGKTWKEGGEAQ